MKKELKNYQIEFDKFAPDKFNYLGRSETRGILCLRIQCRNCGHIFEMTYQSLQENGFRCPNCEIHHSTAKKTPEQYWNEFVNAGIGQLYEIDLSEYTSSNGKIHAKCKRCGAIRYSRARSLISEKTCQNCRNIARSFSEEYVKEQLWQKFQGDIELIEYNGWKQVGTVKCNVCGTISQKIIGPLLRERNKTGCFNCRSLRYVGKNHPSWTRGTQPIDDYLRSALRDTWRRDSLNFYGAKCILSGDTDNLVIHHLNKSFLEMEEQVFEEFGYSKSTIVDEVQQEDLSKMRKRIQQLHYINGYGIPLSDALHKEFHSKYGKVNNTSQQFIEFAKDKGINFKLVDNILIQE